jgi:membrane protein YdbS with pleckstrin-like domain
MDFLNDQVVTENLPKAEAVTFTHIEQKYLHVLRWEWLFAILVLLSAEIILVLSIKWLQRPLPIVLLAAGWLLVTAGWYFLLNKSFSIRGYAIRDKDIIYRSGWIIQHIHTCPFNRIQHITVKVGPMDRRFGFATLVLYSAAPDDADLDIPGLPETLAWELKEWITQKIADEPADLL